MGRELLDEAMIKLAWLSYDCVRKETGSCVAGLSELKVIHPWLGFLTPSEFSQA
jgi:hypothetical protein